ncbi:MAG: pyridoxal phosphate-dependent aminotransferase [bacterium]
MPEEKFLSTRVSQIRPSGIRKIFDQACANPDGIDLSIGDPDFDIPEQIKQEGIFWIEQGFNQYVSTRGIPELRDKLRTYLNSRKINYEDLLITSGATGAYFLAIMSLVGPGDEVLITDPYFVAYANVVVMCGGTPKLINTYPDFSLRAEKIEPLINKRTKAIVINHPNNPTGILYSLDELKMVAQVAEKYGLHILSDEIYDKFVYNEKPFVSMGNVSKDAIIISGFSKSAGMTGWRLGYVSGPQKIIDAMATFQQYSYVCANSIAQKAAVKALDYDIQTYITKYRHRMHLIYDGLKDSFKIIKPGGAFYLFPEAPGLDADQFVTKAIERNLYIIPGNVFSEKNTHFRISFAVDDEKLIKAIDILNQLIHEF